MLDGHGSEMSKKIRETRNRKNNRSSIFDKKEVLSRKYPNKIELKKYSTYQKQQLAKKVNQLTEDEQIRILIIGGTLFIIFLLILLINILK